MERGDWRPRVSAFNPETGEREVQEILLGNAATFAMDLATRERGYGLIKVGVYDMRLTPVGSPPPAWPDDEEYKPALGCWVWNPTFGELRLETNAAIFRQAIDNIWDQARFAPEAMEGLQPVIRFVDRVDVPIKSVGKTFYGPVVSNRRLDRARQGAGLAGAHANRPAARGPAALGRRVDASSGDGRQATPAAKKPAKVGQGRKRGLTILIDPTLRRSHSVVNDDERRRHSPSTRGERQGRNWRCPLPSRIAVTPCP